MYSIAATGKWPLPIAGSQILRSSMALAGSPGMRCRNKKTMRLTPIRTLPTP